jgi:hypothetical protein
MERLIVDNMQKESKASKALGQLESFYFLVKYLEENGMIMDIPKLKKLKEFLELEW